MNETDFFKIIEINTWGDLLNQIGKFDDHWFFRGQQNASWSLSTTIDRSPCTDKQMIESQMLFHLEKNLHLYSQTNFNIRTNPLEGLAILQHYGAPTRLLDFTYSPYVATYFAFEQKSDSCAVYALNYMMVQALSSITLNSPGVISQFNEIEQEEISKPIFDLSESPLFNKLVFRKPQMKFVGAVSPFRGNHRQSSQMGSFLVQGDINATFLENLSVINKSIKETFQPIKMVIAGGLRHEVLNNLEKMNISAKSLFPGLEGFIRSLYPCAEIAIRSAKQTGYEFTINLPNSK